MGIIRIEGINLYAYHGCLPEEGKVGGNYRVDVAIETDLIKSALSDDLNDTVDYCTIFEIAKEEVAIRSKLIEQVAYRILQKLRAKFPYVKEFTVKLTKFSPPMNGPVDLVSVELKG